MNQQMNLECKGSALGRLLAVCNDAKLILSHLGKLSLVIVMVPHVMV
jgi:hypothetical protein